MILRDYLRKIILPLEEIDEQLPQKGKIIDLGCGEGVIAKFIAKKKARTVIGVDSDKKRLPETNSKNLIFKEGDIRGTPLNGINSVVISDVLHHINLPDQKKLLKKISRQIKKGGVLVIKEIDSSEYVRSKLSRLWDLLLYPQDKINYWQFKNLKIFLQSRGFTVKILRPCRLFPGSTTLFICKK